MLGIIVFCHGSRNSEYNELLSNYSYRLKKAYPYQLCLTAFKEFAEPNLENAVTDLIGQGATKIVIAPLFLAPGNHIKKDIPEEVEKIISVHPNTPILIAQHLGVDDRIVDILAARIEEVL